MKIHTTLHSLCGNWNWKTEDKECSAEKGQGYTRSTRVVAKRDTAMETNNKFYFLPVRLCFINVYNV